MKKFVGALLLTIGTFILLFHLVPIFLLLLLGALIYFGITKLYHANTPKQRKIGYFLLGLAILLCLFRVPFLIGLLIAVGLLYFGWRMINHEEHTVYHTAGNDEQSSDSFDVEWQSFLNKQSKQ